MKSIPIKPATLNNTSRAVRGNLETAPWRLVWLLAAPHRLAFFIVALMLVGWVIVLIGFHTHAMAMVYLGATMFAMTTRVSSGYGCRPG